jgi:hypothetical protein
MGEKLGLSLWEKHRLRVSENRMLRKIFGRKRKENGPWRKLHDDELHGLCSSPNNVKVIKSRRVKWAGHIALMGRSVCRVLLRRSEGKRPLERHRRR